jgi:hypothetical protein
MQRGSKSIYGAHLGSVESGHLQTFERSRTGQGDVSLTLLEHPAEIDLDAVQCCETIEPISDTS